MKSLYAVIKNNLRATQYFIMTDSVNAAGNKTLMLSRRFGKRPVTFCIEFMSDGAYIRPSKYTFQSVSSHGDYSTEEMRWTRNKATIFGIVKALKKSSVWSFIENPDFFRLNEKCFKEGKKKNGKKLSAAAIKQLRSSVKEEFDNIFDRQSQKNKAA